jgi:hypothetical protein
LTQLSTTGLLRHESAEALHDWISACVQASLVSVSNDRFRTLSLTPEGREAMRGQLATLQVRRPATRRPVRPWSLTDDDEDEEEDLYLLRRRLRSRWLERYR